MELDPKEIGRLYEKEGWSIARLTSTFHASRYRIVSALEFEKVPIRAQGRPRIPESEWARRRVLALTSLTWEEYGRKIGVPLYANPSLDARHGVRLGCRVCIETGRKRVRPSVTWISTGLSRIAVCGEHRRSAKKT